MRLIAARAVVVTCLVGLTVSSCTGGPLDHKSAASPGTMIDDAGEPAQGTSSYVETPSGRIDFTLTQPVHDLPGYDDHYDRAADGASLIGVTWGVPDIGTPAAMRTTGEAPVQPSISLVAGGRSYSLDHAMLTRYDDSDSTGEDLLGDAEPALEDFGTVYVAVAGTPRDATITVDYDGVTQTALPDLEQSVADHGPAAALYESDGLVSGGTTDCGSGVVDPSTGLRLHESGCQVGISLVPYQQSVGWAGVGSIWLVADVDVYPGYSAARHYRRPDETFYAFDDGPVAATYRLDGAEPVKVVRAATTDAGSAVHERVIFKLPSIGSSGTLVVRAAFPSTAETDSDDVSAPVHLVVPVTWRIPTPS